MRALLFTVFGVIAAATAGISYLALSPAPDQTSDSLTLVIETGSIPATRNTASPDRELPTGALGNETPTANGARPPTLDEVIAARLQQRRQDEGRSAPPASETPASQANAQTAANATAATAGADAPAGGTGETIAPSRQPESGFDVPAAVNAPDGTVSITQMLAAQLSGGEAAANDPAGDAAPGASGQPAGARADQTPSASSDPAKTSGRLGQAEQGSPEPQPTATLSPSASEPLGETGSIPGMAVAALDPQAEANATPGLEAGEAAAPEVTQDDPPAASREAGATPEEPASEPQVLAAADAPALPRQRGDYRLQGRIALIIRGLGVEPELTEQAIAAMPQQVAMAFVPYGDDLQTWTRRARADRHDILIQIPLEPEGYPEINPGPHTLLTSLSIDENLGHLDWLLDRFDGITGVTNYMGGKFASSPGSFAPMLMELKARDLLYVDDSKAANATTQQLARQVSLAYSVADVVIDTQREPEAIQEKLAELEARAREDGSAIAIGHAHAATLAAVESWLGSLRDKGLALVPITELTAPPTPRVSQTTGG